MGSYGKSSSSMKYIGGDAVRLLGRVHNYIPPFSFGFATMLNEFPKKIGKSRDKFYPTHQTTSSILVPTL